MVLTLLQNPHTNKLDNKGGDSGTTLLVADTGATDHMLPDKSVFISYYPVVGWRVCMGYNSFALIHGYGTTIIFLNRKKILIRDCLHIPNLRTPLYRLHARQRQHGCGFIGMYGLGFHMFFPMFIIKVDTATNCHLHYDPVGHSAVLPELNYVQPTFPLNASASATLAASLPPATIELDNNDDYYDSNNVICVFHLSKAIDLNTIIPTAFT